MSYTEAHAGGPKKKEKRKGFDAQFADELAQGMRAASSSRDHFLRAIGESRMISRAEQDGQKKKQDNEFIRKTQADHRKKVKREMKASAKRSLLESIMKPGKDEREEKKGDEEKNKEVKKERRMEEED